MQSSGVKSRQQTKIVRQVEIAQSPRVKQVESIFDVPPSSVSKVEWNIDFELPEKWNVGLIVGPSGSGKTTVAEEIFGDYIVPDYHWSPDKAMIDDFPEIGIKDITHTLTSVGFGSAPNWLRPYHVLSMGEKFRATVARALTETSDIIAIDEFSSVIDRKVAQVASHTIQKAVRRDNRQFIAISCHYDIVEWLQPDWIYQPDGDQFSRRSLRQRPTFELKIHPVDKSVWKFFRKYHYLNTSLASQARCFGGFIDGECVAFNSYVHFPHPNVKNIRMGHRLVVHPDFQGMGIGGKMDDWLGQHLYDTGYRYHCVTAHPAMINYYSKSHRWQFKRSGLMSTGSKKVRSKNTQHLKTRALKFSGQRNSYTFCYVPPADPNQPTSTAKRSRNKSRKNPKSTTARTVR